MNLDLFTLLIGLGALVAGFLGSLTGLGGGVVIVPLLTLGFGVLSRHHRWLRPRLIRGPIGQAPAGPEGRAHHRRPPPDRRALVHPRRAPRNDSVHRARRAARGDFRVFRGEPFDLTTAPAIVGAAVAGGREAIIQLGVLILIATPIARVLLSLVAFALQRDRTYIVVTLIVLVVLLAGLFGVRP